MIEIQLNTKYKIGYLIICVESYWKTATKNQEPARLQVR